MQRGRAPRPEGEPDATFATRTGHDVAAWRVDAADGELRLRIWSEQRQRKDEAIVAHQRERFEKELQALRVIPGLDRQRTTRAAAPSPPLSTNE